MYATQFLIGALLTIVVTYGCAAKDKKARTRSEFCEDWGQAACSKETVSACQAGNTEDCAHSQEELCRALVPAAGFSDARGDACIDAIDAAYADAELDADELATVLRLDPPCDQLWVGPKAEGEACSSRRDCDSASGFDCVKKADADRGTCQVPREVGGGRDCSAARAVCEPGFYCDGSHCVEGKAAGDDCAIDAECASGAFCDEDGACRARLDVDEPCTADAQCASGICYEFEGETVCTDRVVLSRSEPICSDLR
jgi:hypothetical protein